MERAQTVVIFMLMASALSLVSSQHRGRSLFVALEKSRSQARQLDTEWRRLQLDLSTNSKQAIIDTVARRDLHMSPITPGRTLYLGLAQAPTVAPGSAAAAAISAADAATPAVGAPASTQDSHRSSKP